MTPARLKDYVAALFVFFVIVVPVAIVVIALALSFARFVLGE